MPFTENATAVDMKRAISKTRRYQAQQVTAANPNFGFNAQTNTYEDLVVSGVIDPTKVTRTALQNAASIASLMLTTEAMVAEIPEKKSGPSGPPGGHGGEMDY